MKTPATQLNIDDVVNAYRWILGREPGSSTVIERRMRVADRAELRRQLLMSAEFHRDFAKMTARSPAPPALPPLDPSIDRLVFLHIPKTGGTTLHELLAAAVGADRVSVERHNGLWRRSGAELAAARLFSGHYDRRCLSVVPGRRVRVVTLLRDPSRRLLSVYRFLRAHRPRFIAHHKMALATAAREKRYGDFLQAALTINPAAVDNTYLRALGASLPDARWEQRAEPRARKRVDELGPPPEEMLARARGFLDEMAAVGVLERFDASFPIIFRALGLPVPENYKILQRLSDLVVQNPDLEPVDEVAISDADRRLTDELTRFDVELYDHAQRLHATAVADAATQPKGDAVPPTGDAQMAVVDSAP